MLSLSAKIRKTSGKKVKLLRKKGVIPAVLYGPKLKENLSLEVDLKEFKKAFKEAGESSLISLDIKDLKEDSPTKSNKKHENLVLIHEVTKNPLTREPIHIDFFQPLLEEEIEARVSLIFEGEAPAVKEFGGTLVKNISEIGVKALPQNLPKEIIVNVNSLKTLEDNILVKDLIVPLGVKVLRHPEEIVALVAPPEKIEEELEKPVEEKVEEVEKVEKKKKEEVAEEEIEAEEVKKETKKQP